MKTNRSDCPLTNVLDIVGDKWSLLVIRDIFMGKENFYGVFKIPRKNCYKHFGKSLGITHQQGVT